MRRGPVHSYRPLIDLDLGYAHRHGYRDLRRGRPSSFNVAAHCGTPRAVALHRRRCEALCEVCKPVEDLMFGGVRQHKGRTKAGEGR